MATVAEVVSFISGLSSRAVTGQNMAAYNSDPLTGYTNRVLALYTSTGRYPGCIGGSLGSAALYDAQTIHTLKAYWWSGGLVHISHKPLNPWTGGSQGDMT